MYYNGAAHQRTIPVSFGSPSYIDKQLLIDLRPCRLMSINTPYCPPTLRTHTSINTSHCPTTLQTHTSISTLNIALRLRGLMWKTTFARAFPAHVRTSQPTSPQYARRRRPRHTWVPCLIKTFLGQRTPSPTGDIAIRLPTSIIASFLFSICFDIFESFCRVILRA
jgi:hypothetical protein